MFQSASDHFNQQEAGNLPMAGNHTPAFPRLSDSERGRCPLPLSRRILRRTSAFFPRRHYNKLSYASRYVDLPRTKSHPSANKDTYAHTHAHACARAMMGIWTNGATDLRPLRGSSRHPHQQRRVRTHARSAGRLGGTRKQAGTLSVSRKGSVRF